MQWKHLYLFVSWLQHQEQHSEGRSSSTNEPHLIFIYEDKQILEDAASLISYYVKRQPTIQKEDQATIRQIVHHFIPELFFSQPPEHSISEESTDEDRENHQGQNLDTPELRKKHVPGPPSSPLETKATFCDVTAAEPHNTLDDVYSLFFVNNNWYFFLRLHQTLCSRLLKIYRQAQKQLLEYRTEKEREKLLCEGRKEKTNDPAMELRLKQPSKNTLWRGALLMFWLYVGNWEQQAGNVEVQTSALFAVHGYGWVDRTACLSFVLLSAFMHSSENLPTSAQLSNVPKVSCIKVLFSFKMWMALWWNSSPPKAWQKSLRKNCFSLSALLRENSAKVFQHWMSQLSSSAVLYTSWLHSASCM